MRTSAALALAVALMSLPLVAQQERKPVPKDSVRISIPGCTKGYIFTAGPRTPDETSPKIPEGTHLRMNLPKKMMAEIKAQEGSMIQITGIMKKGQLDPNGVNLGGGVRMTPGPSPTDTGRPVSPIGYQVTIDVESWSPFAGGCPR